MQSVDVIQVAAGDNVEAGGVDRSGKRCAKGSVPD